jgi:putative nucleotidyltransferase with HDIG domain
MNSVSTSRRRIEESIAKATDLPTLSAVATVITQEINNPRTNAVQIGRRIAQDPVISTNVLKLVNSAYFGFPRRIGDVNQAVALLGFDEVRKVVLTVSILEALRSRRIEGFDLTRYWKHSVVAALAASVVASACMPNLKADAYFSGLLHDIGRLILFVFFREDLERALSIVQKTGCALHEAERQVIEVDHGQVGAWLLQKWRFPPEMVEAVRCHHAPQSARNHEKLSALVHVGDVFADAALFGLGLGERIQEIAPGVRSVIDLHPSRLDRIFGELFQEIKRAEAFLELIQ